MRQITPVSLLLAFALLLPACGGGAGSGDGTAVPTSAPVYGTAWFRARDLDGVHRALTGTFAPMADGRFDLDLLEVDGTTLRADDIVIPYEVLQRGTKQTLRHTVHGLDAHGAGTPDGQLKGFAKLEGGSLPGIQLMVPRGTPTVSSMRGTWRLVGMGGQPGNFAVYDGTIIFNGSGTYNVAQRSQNGAPIGIVEHSSGSYRIDGDQRLIIERSGGSLVMGHVSQSGEYAIVAGDFSADLRPSFYLLMRDHPGLTAAAVSGEYTILTMRHGGAAGFTSSRGLFRSTGFGTGTRRIIESNRESVHSVAALILDLPITYAAGSDNALRVDRAGRPNARGFVSPSEDVVALVNDRGLGTDPFLELWIRH